MTCIDFSISEHKTFFANIDLLSITMFYSEFKCSINISLRLWFLTESNMQFHACHSVNPFSLYQKISIVRFFSTNNTFLVWCKNRFCMFVYVLILIFLDRPHEAFFAMEDHRYVTTELYLYKGSRVLSAYCCIKCQLIEIFCFDFKMF